jgi:signal transduction histidine kinase
VTDGGSVLQFPDGPKTALDELIDQLVEGAGQVRRAQGRLRGLLRASASVSEDLAVDAVLHNLVQAAAGLTDAGSSAVVVFSADGTRRDVVHTGLSDERVASLRDGVPPPDTAVSRPLTMRDEKFGEVIVFDSAHPRFTDEDAELLGALAATASTALSHADLFDESQRHHRWLRANAAIVQQILTSDGEDPLSVVARMAAELAFADLVTVSLLTADGGEVVVEAAFGERAEEYVGQRFPVSGTPAGAALADGMPVPVTDYRTVSGGARTISSTFDAGPVMLVPLVGSQRTWGLMSVVRTHGRDPFSPEELAMASDFANHATISLELAEARLSEQRMRVMEDRERIARDLHDHVIQELFAIGLGIESAAGSPAVPDDIRHRLRDRVEDLDRTIRRVRTSIFALRGRLDRTRDELRSAVLDLVTELTPVLGFAPSVEFSGAPGAASSDLVDDVTAVLREALTNVARHAGASSATVDVVAGSDQLLVTVVDDGVGVGDAELHSGTANLRRRAERRRGTCSIAPGPLRGTVLTWKVRLT